MKAQRQMNRDTNLAHTHKGEVGECIETIDMGVYSVIHSPPWPHYSVSIQLARGDVGLKFYAALRPEAQMRIHSRLRARRRRGFPWDATRNKVTTKFRRFFPRGPWWIVGSSWNVTARQQIRLRQGCRVRNDVWPCHTCTNHQMERFFFSAHTYTPPHTRTTYACMHAHTRTHTQIYAQNTANASHTQTIARNKQTKEKQTWRRQFCDSNLYADCKMVHGTYVK